MEDEILDVFDERGWHLGTKRRGDVHRDGDWHLAFHLWVVRGDGVLLQRRAADKASWPGYLDASAAGHLLAGEAIQDGIREAEEELGAAYAFDDLASLGVHRVADPERSGIVNRELQHVFAVRDERPLAEWTSFDRVEVAGLVLVDHAGFAALAAALADGDGNGVRVAGREWDGTAERATEVAPAEVVPAPYLAAIAADLRRVAGAQL
ncbi:Isopentenyl-diphosphate Delta-isomerase [Baekduia alba]|uniref:NUDIX hydrolase n=1 Tax=Baekduia alba TaxID=2997333 RepID=UPI002341F2D6|nr:NUDIX domain-containing protein [Baekduia alba]WCB96433.1 Isopentenyl-diphosphate Delta-isomerase [Baekduia alba]